VESRVISVSGGASFVYDGDCNRVMKTENCETALYVSRYYKKNPTTGVESIVSLWLKAACILSSF
jgi:hypothetical protein